MMNQSPKTYQVHMQKNTRAMINQSAKMYLVHMQKKVHSKILKRFSPTHNDYKVDGQLQEHPNDVNSTDLQGKEMSILNVVTKSESYKRHSVSNKAGDVVGGGGYCTKNSGATADQKSRSRLC
jgi:hypothetical protein